MLAPGCSGLARFGPAAPAPALHMRPPLLKFSALAVGAAVAVALLVRRRLRRRLAVEPPHALFFGPAAEYADEVSRRLRTAWVVETASSDPNERRRQAAAATALVGGLLPANEMMRSAGPSLRLLQVHFTGTDWLEKGAVPAGVAVCNATGMEVPIAEWVLGAIIRHVDGITAAGPASTDLGWSRVISPDASPDRLLTPQTRRCARRAGARRRAASTAASRRPSSRSRGPIWGSNPKLVDPRQACSCISFRHRRGG